MDRAHLARLHRQERAEDKQQSLKSVDRTEEVIRLGGNASLHKVVHVDIAFLVLLK